MYRIGNYFRQLVALTPGRTISKNNPAKERSHAEISAMNTPRLTLIAALLAITLSCATAEEKKTNADNTDRNKQDQNGKTRTPMDQSNDPADIRLVATIRKMVVDDKSLSATAKNCKIITAGGMVTLRGPVNTAEEKSAIEAHAVMCSAKNKVDNQLEVKVAK